MADPESRPSRSWLGRAAERVLHLHDTPERTAAAFALGVFFSFSPFIGLQIALSMGLAFLLGLNRVAVFAGLNANLPWFLVPWYAGTTLAAASVLGHDPGQIWQQVAVLFAPGWTPVTFLEGARALVAQTFVPLMVGPTVGALMLAVLTYAVVRAVLLTRARRQPVGQDS